MGARPPRHKNPFSRGIGSNRACKIEKADRRTGTCEPVRVHIAPADHRLPGASSALRLDAPSAQGSRRVRGCLHARVAGRTRPRGLLPDDGTTHRGSHLRAGHHAAPDVDARARIHLSKARPGHCRRRTQGREDRRTGSVYKSSGRRRRYGRKARFDSGDDLYEGFALGAGFGTRLGDTGNIGIDLAWRPVKEGFDDIIEIGMRLKF